MCPDRNVNHVPVHSGLGPGFALGNRESGLTLYVDGERHFGKYHGRIES